MPAKASKGPKDLKCPKCGDSMEAGFLPGPGFYLMNPLFMSVEWSPGRPQASADFALKKSARKRRIMTTMRCTSCGFLESYAR